MTMIDRAARAMCARNEGREDVWDDLSEREREGYRGDVRAVLHAIREADAETRMVGRNAVLRSNAGPHLDYSVAIGHGFTAMIDAILAEGEKAS